MCSFTACWCPILFSISFLTINWWLGTTNISSKETFFIFNYKYAMHFTWQNGMVTFFLAVVAVTSWIMAFNGMQQHCMVQFINFNRLTISLLTIVTIWAGDREEWPLVSVPPSLSLWGYDTTGCWHSYTGSSQLLSITERSHRLSLSPAHPPLTCFLLRQCHNLCLLVYQYISTKQASLTKTVIFLESNFKSRT